MRAASEGEAAKPMKPSKETKRYRRELATRILRSKQALGRHDRCWCVALGLEAHRLAASGLTKIKLNACGEAFLLRVLYLPAHVEEFDGGGVTFVWAARERAGGHYPSWDPKSRARKNETADMVRRKVEARKP
jgi:hypothetical protein